MLTRSSIQHQENILPVFFHLVLFTRQFFQGKAVILQFNGKYRVIPDLIQEKLFFHFEAVQLIVELFAVQHIVAVKKSHPYNEGHCDHKVLIDEYPEDLFYHGEEC